MGTLTLERDTAPHSPARRGHADRLAPGRPSPRDFQILSRVDPTIARLGTPRARALRQEDPFSIRANPPRGGDAKPRARREPDSRVTEGGVAVTPREHGGLPQEGDHRVLDSAGRRQMPGARPSPRRSSPRRSPEWSR